MANETIVKFGYPDTLLREYDHWVVLLRPKQVTAGSMVLACKEETEAVSGVSGAAWSELARVTRDLETAVRDAFAFDKINYLALMMVDPHVHFHVLPRYEASREFEQVVFEDTAWPGPPDITDTVSLTPEEFERLAAYIRSSWPSADR